MNGRRSFKTDESFLEKISIGAVGTLKVFNDLVKQGHNPIELERGSMSFKIWKGIKIKRVRVPDILCVNCGKRVESRGKTKLEITMSHSVSTPERGWDFGLNDDDYIALVKCTKAGKSPTDWIAEDPVQYVQVSSMRDAYQKNLAVSEKPKGATEGFELRVTWPSCTASEGCSITVANSEKIQYRRLDNNRAVTLRLTKRGIKLEPQLKLGEKAQKNQIIASSVPILLGFDCRKTTSSSSFIDLLTSPSLSDRYMASKALTRLPSESATEALVQTVKNEKEHIYVRLEAASTLVKTGHLGYLSFFKGLLSDPYLENRLECVIVLGEINAPESCDLLVNVLLDQDQHPEIRAGAAWSLGELKNKKAMDALIKVFDETQADVREEAARALMRFGNDYSKEIIGFINTSSEDQRAGIAWALSKSGKFTVRDLLGAMADDDARRWVSWIVGTQDEAKYINQIEELKKKDGEVYFTVTVLWKILSSWIADLEIY